MAVDALYLLDSRRRIRRAIVWGVYELIHDEASYKLDAEIDVTYSAEPGEYLGFFDVDHHFRLFSIDKADDDDQRGVTVITATDSAIAQLAHSIVPEVRLEAATARQAAEAVLSGSGFALGSVTDSEETNGISVYMQARWKVLRDMAVQYQLRITPYYEIVDGEIAGRRVDVTERTSEYRGRLLEGASGTSQIYVTRSGIPITRMYGYGKATGEEDPPTCVTFADVVWSRANGDPADKPAGQTYIDDPDADSADVWEEAYNDKYEEDPENLLASTWAELQKRRKPKVSGTATASDMEDIPGHEHKIVRLHDKVVVRTKRGEDVEASVIGIKRNYLQRGLTKITVGEETDDSGLIQRIAKLSSDSSAQEKTAQATSNRLIITKQLVQVNADTIQLNARLLEANTQKIDLTASNLKKFEEGTDERLTAAELVMFGDGTSANAGLVARVSDAEGEISHAALTLYGDGTSANAGLVAKVGDNAASITLHADELGTLAEIKADKVDLGNYATVKKLEAELSDIQLALADSITTRTLNVTSSTNTDTLLANSASISSMRLEGYNIEMKSMSVVTSVPLLVTSTGGVVTAVEAKPVSATLKYLTWTA
ncbi:MAG: phage tail spike protein [Candidatus Ventricola sp.]